jgi:hypothetical protein
MRDDDHEMLPARTAVESMTPRVTRLTETWRMSVGCYISLWI